MIGEEILYINLYTVHQTTSFSRIDTLIESGLFCNLISLRDSHLYKLNQQGRILLRKHVICFSIKTLSKSYIYTTKPECLLCLPR